MNLRLILDTSPTSHNAEIIWREACRDSGDTLEIVNATSDQFQSLVEHLHLNTFPALVHGNQVLAVGKPTPEGARKFLTGLAAGSTH